MRLSRLSALALCAALAFLALPSPAQSPQKPSPPTLAQLQQRIDDLEKRLADAELKAKSAALDSDYTQRVQKQYEAYYEKAFNTQVIIVTIIALVVGLVGKFGVDRIMQSKLSEASVQLRTEYREALSTEVQKLKEANAADIKALDTALTTRIAQLERDLKARSEYQFQFAQGMAADADKRFAAARTCYRNALEIYRGYKPRKLFRMSIGATIMQNLLVTFMQEYEADNYEKKVKEELANPIYDELNDELADVSIELPWLQPLLKERKENPPPPPAPPTPKPA